MLLDLHLMHKIILRSAYRVSQLAVLPPPVSERIA